MRATRLKDYWKGADGYCRSYVLITKKYSVDDIKMCGKDIVLFGWFPKAAHLVETLKEHGIFPKYVCEVDQIPFTDNGETDLGNGLILKDYRELLNEAKKYFFLFFSEDDRKDIWLSDLVKRVRLLQYQGVSEFGIISDTETRDIFGQHDLVDCVYDTINEIFAGAGLLDWGTYWFCLTQAGLDFQNWDYPFDWLVRHFKNQPAKKLLEVGPGIGVCSISLKKMLDFDITWLTIPEEEPVWNAWRNDSSLNIFKKYNIHIKETFVEEKDFEGTYDVILMSQVLEHFIFNPVPTIKRLVNHLSDDGILCISVPDTIYNDPKNVESYKDIPLYESLTVRERVVRTKVNNFTHFHEYSYDEALELFDECGLECIDSHTNLPIYHFILKKRNINA